jgi:hypothetical protein
MAKRCAIAERLELLALLVEVSPLHYHARTRESNPRHGASWATRQRSIACGNGRSRRRRQRPPADRAFPEVSHETEHAAYRSAANPVRASLCPAAQPHRLSGCGFFTLGFAVAILAVGSLFAGAAGTLDVAEGASAPTPSQVAGERTQPAASVTTDGEGNVVVSRAPSDSPKQAAGDAVSTQ